MFRHMGAMGLPLFRECLNTLEIPSTEHQQPAEVSVLRSEINFVNKLAIETVVARPFHYQNDNT